MGSGRTVVVYGAYGHTGRFVVRELDARGFTPVLSGRDPAKLAAFAIEHPGLELRPAAVDDPAALDRALAGADAVIGCAGPFVRTAAPLIEAALRAGIPYVDVAAEVDSVRDTFEQFGDPARDAGVAVVPAMAFYGGLGDLLVTAAMGDWTCADEAHIVYGLDSWHPTAGTRSTIAAIFEGSEGKRACWSKGRLEYRDGEPPIVKWTLPEPMGVRQVMGEFNLADAVTVPSHLSIPEVSGYLTLEAAGDVMAPDTPTPIAVDDYGRSAQTFIVDVAVHRDNEVRRACARGQDAYAVTAPLVVEAVHRILSGSANAVGVAAAGAIFDATDFLRSLSTHLTTKLASDL